MTMVVFTSVSGAPGASTLALGIAVAWPEQERRRVVIEADPDGGTFGAELGVGTEPGLMALAVSARRRYVEADDLIEQGAARMGGWWLVPAPPSAEQSAAALGHGAVTLALAAADEPSWLWLVDAGRLSTRSPSMPFAASADLVVIVTAGSLAALQLVPTRVQSLTDAGCPVGLVVSGPTEWPGAEIADFCGCEVLGRLPRVRGRHAHDRTLSGAAWRPWWSSVRDLGRTLRRVAAAPADPDPECMPERVTERGARGDASGDEPERPRRGARQGGPARPTPAVEAGGAR